MSYTRREILAAGTVSLAALLTKANAAGTPRDTPRTRMGVVIHSYWNRKASDKEHSFDDPLTFLDYCRSIGAGGVQTSLGIRDDAYVAKIQTRLSEHKVYVEGSIALPRDRDDVERFTNEVRTAKRCGAKLFRTVLMNGRRYEVFDSAEAYRKFFEQGKQSLKLAMPIVEKHEIRMAIENHKDLQAPDLLDLIKKLDSPLAGVCIDTGNNIALLEAPQETVDILAPHAFTTHIKDMGVEEYAEGFLLSEVPLGTGFLDLTKIVATVRKARPDITLNLEMMTRDPLKVPVLTPKYWATLEHVPAKRLAEMLALVRAKAGKTPLPRISELKKEEQLQHEDENVRQCLRYAQAKFD
jgi:sugar phosphate isomerase/epimerase